MIKHSLSLSLSPQHSATFCLGKATESRSSESSPAYFPATVNKKVVLFELETVKVGQSVRIKECVEPKHIRSAPPCELNQWFKAGDEVDAFREGDGCWIKGNVKDILDSSRYLVGFGRGDDHREIEVDHFNLRLHREWDDGAWVPSLLQQVLHGFLACGRLVLGFG